MTRFDRLRTLARYNVFTPFAVLAAAALAQPALAATIIVNAPDTDGVVLADGDSLVNNSDISNPGGRGVEGGAGTTPAFTNNAGASISGSLQGVRLGTVGAFTNAGTIAGTSEAGVSIDSLDSFVNSGAITGFGGVGIGGPVALFRNEAAGVIDGGSYLGVNFNSDVESFFNAGTITGDPAFFGVLFDWGVEDFYNSGVISGGKGVFVGGDAGTFVNAGAVTGQLGVDFAGSVDSFRNEADGLIEGTDEYAARFAGLVGDFYNAGTIIGGSEDGVYFVFGATVGRFANAGSILGRVTFDDDVGFFRNEAGALIEGTSEGVNFNASVTDFYNAGTISGSSFGVYVQNGMLSGTNAAGGMISSPNGAALYFESVGTVTFDNAGTISGGDTGIRVQAVQAGSTNIINSGTIEGQFLALDFDYGGGTARDDRLTLLTGSRIFGNIDFAYGSDTLDFSGFVGNTILEVSNLETVVAGNVNYVWDQPGETLAIFDLTGPSGIGSGLAEVTGAINGVVGRQFASGQGGAGPFAYAPSPRLGAAASAAESAVLSELDVGGGSKAWATVFGGGSADTAPVNVSNLFGGLVAGAHARLGEGVELGLLGGYAHSAYDVLSGQQTVGTDTGVFGAYGRAELGVVDLGFSLLGGVSAHQSEREVVAMGVTETAAATFGSWFLSPSLMAEVPVLSGAEGELSVAASATYVGGSVAGYTETGSSMNLIVGSQTIGNFEGRIGLSGEMAASSGVTLTADAGLFALASLGSSSVPVTVIGLTVDAVTPGSSGYGAYAGLGLDAALAEGVAISLGLDGSLRNDGLLSAAATAKLEGSF